MANTADDSTARREERNSWDRRCKSESAEADVLLGLCHTSAADGPVVRSSRTAAAAPQPQIEGSAMQKYLELTKPRITALILVCTAVGYVFGSAGPVPISTLVYALLGTALMASGTAALNQWSEATVDGQMRRTRLRPIPTGRIERAHALFFGTALAVAGFGVLWLETNLLAALLGLFTLLSYLLIYTPMKLRSPACTTIGAIPGAMPPLIGFVAASGTLSSEAWALFLILFIWQFPHFYSIAWMYRDDYARGGIRMLPVVEPDGESTARRIVAAAVLLLPVALLP